jgi:AcrR family transcriptional regulator
MIVSTVLLMRERGARATSLDAILEHSGAPRGSVYHHFPGGREQLLREATDYAGRYLARRLERGRDSDDPLAALEQLCDEYREILLATEFRAGCPVVAVAVESGQDGPDLRPEVARAFDSWSRTLADGFAEAGIPRASADDLGTMALASLEGALILCRAQRDVSPLETVRRRLREQLAAELASESPRTTT